MVALTAGKLAALPVVYQHHSSLGAELEAWFPPPSSPGQAWRSPLAWVMPRLGHGLDLLLPRLATTSFRLHAGQRGSARVLPLGVPKPYAGSSSFLEFDQRRKEIIYTGNFDPYQAPSRLVAFAEALTRNPEGAQLQIYSDGPVPQRLRSGSRPLPRLLSEELKRIEEARLMIVPRVDAHGMPLKILNALCVGTPVVLNAGLWGALGEREGVVSLQGEPERLAAEAQKLSEDPQRWTRLSKAALAFSEEHSFDKLAQACEEGYRAMRSRASGA